MSDAKEFHVGTVLTILTDRLLSPDHMGGVYAICEYMSGESGLMTHQLPRVMTEIKPYLVAQYPELAKVVPPADLDSWDKVFGWMDTEVYDTFGEVLTVAPIPPEAHTHIDPISELKMKRPDMQIITVEIPHDE